jgi:hypothetical protein
MIEGGAHHSDIGNNYNPIPTTDDTPALVRAREEEILILRGWIAQFNKEREQAKRFLSDQ